MSYTLRRMQRPESKRYHIILSDELPSFWRSEQLPTPQQQLDALVLWIGANQRASFENAEILAPALAAFLGMHISQQGDGGGLGWLLGQFDEKKLLTRLDVGAGKLGFKLTFDGWQRLEVLKRTNIQSRTAFMAMKFGDATLNRVVEDCFRPGVGRAGFNLRLLTDEQPAGLIDDQLRAAILGSRFLISDLTHGNQGAYWEAGFAEGLGLPVIYTCSAEKWTESKTHFDTNHMVTIIWDLTDLPKAGRELTATIRATLRAEAKQSDDA